MARHKYVEEYIDQYRSGNIVVNHERELLFNWIEEKVYPREDIWFNEEMIDDCIAFIEKWFFKLEPFQKFLIAFVFLFYKGKKKVVFNKHFWTLGRGGGKNGLASGLSTYLISSRHNVKGYNVGIVATSEDQATTSVEEVYNVVDDNKPLQKYFKHGVSKILSKLNRNWFKYYTSNAKTKDGARLGCIIFDEIHEYVTNAIINVFTSGFGKRPYSRRIFMGTNGYVRDGVYDNLIRRSMDILTGASEDFSFFPFICKVDDIKEVDEPEMWQKANPMFHPPMSEYAEILFDEVISDYKDLQYGGDKIEFIVKRMNFDDVDGQQNVASRKDILAANQTLPDLKGMPCIGTLDLSSNKDFTAVGLTFRKEEMYYFKTHTFVPRTFLNNYKLEVPIEEEWSKPDFKNKQGPLLTIVEEVDIPIEIIVDWFVKQRDVYELNTVIIDWYRKDYAEKALSDAGFDVIVVRKSQAIAAGIGIRVQSMFSRHLIHWGHNPLMNWYTNNVLVGRDRYDNITFEKKEKVRRKIDGFMALMLGVWKSDELVDSAPTTFDYDDTWIF